MVADLIIFAVAKNIKGNQAKDVISPTCPASKYPNSFGAVIYKIAAKRLDIFFNPKFLARKNIPDPAINA